MNDKNLKDLLANLVKQPSENEWVEFKKDFHGFDELGRDISALANGACINNQPYAYIVFGVKDVTHKIIGTKFSPSTKKKGNEILENWLATRLQPKIDFRIYEFNSEHNLHVVLFKIPAARSHPVTFLKTAYIRIGSVTRELHDFPAKAKQIWKHDNKSSEKEIVKEGLDILDVIKLLSTETYFDLMKLPYPQTQAGVIDKLVEERLVVKSEGYSITKLGALLFAKNLRDFEGLERKSVRVIVYKGKNKIETIREQIGSKGYAIGFAGLVEWVNGQLPANEEIGKVLRRDVRMYPEIAVRELIANALIHQDLDEKGFPMIEIFADRIEISNPGTPLVTPERFIDGYLSRNEQLADLMRRMGFCEEKGSGLDKVIFYNELYQLPPIDVVVTDNRTRVSIFSYRTLNELDKKEKVRACYQHACLKYVSNEKMTNQSLRERFKIEGQNIAIASRIIRDSVESKLIKEDNPESKSRKYASYLPFWA